MFMLLMSITRDITLTKEDLKKFKPLSKKSFYLILLKRIKISKTTFLCRFSEAVKVTDILLNYLTNTTDFLILNEYCQSDKRILIVERSSRWKWPQNLCSWLDFCRNTDASRVIGMNEDEMLFHCKQGGTAW